ncbi:light-harvesting complex protein [Aureococcus anophagefferens]|nr:light-harvesting complex protein [Aureococcus anophagefferens]
MQKLIIASSIATATAFVAPTSTASASTLKAQKSMEGPTVDPWYMDGKEPDLSKIRGVFPGKSMPADYGFDPLGVAAIDVFSSGDDDYLRVKNYRDAEAPPRPPRCSPPRGPVQELVHPWLNKALDAPNLLSDGRSPSAKEINNGRLAMVAVACYVAQEAATGEPIVALSEGLFTPIIYMPWFQHVMDTAFGISSFRV